MTVSSEPHVSLSKPKRTGNPYQDFPKWQHMYATTYNGGEVKFWICPLCGALCSEQSRSIYTHVDYHEARGETV
jgi:hypothetical protein